MVQPDLQLIANLLSRDLQFRIEIDTLAGRDIENCRLERLNLFSEIGRVFRLNRVFQLDIQKQSIAKPNDGSLEGALAVIFRPSCQFGLFFDLAKERPKVIKRIVVGFSFAFLPTKETENVRISHFENFCSVRALRAH